MVTAAMNFPIRVPLTALLLAAAPAAQAHIVFAEPQAPPGSYYAGFLRVSHGCDGAATTAIRVSIPAAAESVKPQPKPGWTLSVEREPLPAPIKGDGGAEIRDRVVAVTWTGRLPADQFDQFGIMMKLSAEASGPLYFPTVQQCGANSIGWTGIPAAGEAWHSLKTPAPVLNVGAAPPAPHMQH